MSEPQLKRGLYTGDILEFLLYQYWTYNNIVEMWLPTHLMMQWEAESNCQGWGGGRGAAGSMGA